MPSRTTRTIAIAASAAFLVTSADLRMAAAGPASPSKSPGQEMSAAGTDFSARKRKRVRRGGGNAAAAAAIIGTIGAIAAAQAHRKRYRTYYGYGAPGYYYGPPAYTYSAPVYHPRWYGEYGRVGPRGFTGPYGTGATKMWQDGEYRRAVPRAPKTYSHPSPAL